METRDRNIRQALFMVLSSSGGMYSVVLWLFGIFWGLGETCERLASAGDNPNPEIPETVIFFGPWFPWILDVAASVSKNQIKNADHRSGTVF